VSRVPWLISFMAYVHQNDYWFGTTKSPQESTEKAIELVQKALPWMMPLAEAQVFWVFSIPKKGI